MSIPPDELDRRAEVLNKKLQNLLALFLLGQLSAELAKAFGAQFIEEAYIDFMVLFRIQNETPGNYNTQAQRIMKVLEQIKQDFNNIIDKKGKKEQVKTEEGLKLRVFLISLGLIFMLQRQSIIELALTIKAQWIRWNNTIIPPWPCETCIGLAGLHRPNEVPDRPHPSCKCWLSLEY